MLSSAFIEKLANNGLLRYRGTRGGRLTHTYRESWIKRGSQSCAEGTSATTISLVAQVGHLAVCPLPSTPTPSPPTLYVFNACSIAKPHAIEQLTAELIGYDVDIAVVSETHLKPNKHNDSVVNVDGYNLFRRDRQGRRGGGVAMYVRRSMSTTVWTTPDLDSVFEMLWVKVSSSGDVTFVGALYHPPQPLYRTSELVDIIEATTAKIHRDYPDCHIILAGDFNTMPDNDVVIATGLTSVVLQPTRGNSRLDRIYVSDLEYDGVKVVKSAVTSDHHAVVAYCGGVRATVGKTRRVCTFRKHTTAQHARFLTSVSASFHVVSPDGSGDPQLEFDKLYDSLRRLLDEFYPMRTVTITSADPPFVTPTVKCMMRRKNALMRAGNVERAAALAVKIGDAFKRHNSAELSRVDVLSDPRNMWAKVRQLTGRSKSAVDASQTSAVTADVLNRHYAAISTDANYTAPSVKQTVANWRWCDCIDEWRMFQILDKLRPTATGLDDIPAWFLKIGAPFFAAPLADMFNLSLSSSVVPKQWKAASILPIPKIASPHTPADYRPISITPVLSRIMERIVVTDYIYPSLQSPPPTLTFIDQFAFQPTSSTTAALIQLLHTVTTLLDSNLFVIVYALDFSKAFDSVRHSAVLDKYLQLHIPDNIYNWIEAFFRDHSHCTRFGSDCSGFQKILASIIQGSAIGPASYVVTAADLHPITVGNSMVKYADDTYLVVPATNAKSCAAEISNIENWAIANNLQLNRAKSAEIVFVSPKSRRLIEIPPPAVPGFDRVDQIKVLGVTISRKFSTASHVQHLLAACAQTLFALRTLRHHGLNSSSIQTIFQATVVAKLAYASPAWVGFASAADRARLEAFLKRSVSFGYRSATSPTFASICDDADNLLFKKVLSNRSHLLYPLLPPLRENPYNLRARCHPHQLPARTTALRDNNFIIRMLFKDTRSSAVHSH